MTRVRRTIRTLNCYIIIIYKTWGKVTGHGAREPDRAILANLLFPYCCCYVASVVSDSVRPPRRQPTRLPRPWDSPGKNTGVGCHFLLQCMKVESESEVAQSCPTLRDPMHCSLTGSPVHGIFQARVLEWAAIAFSMLFPYTCVKSNQVPIHLKWTKQWKSTLLQYKIKIKLQIKLPELVVGEPDSGDPMN